MLTRQASGSETAESHFSHKTFCDHSPAYLFRHLENMEPEIHLFIREVLPLTQPATNSKDNCNPVLDPSRSHH